MGQRIVLVTHDAGPRDDRASQILSERGFALEWTCPAKGGRLPDPEERDAGAIVYGGLPSINDRDTHTYLNAELDWVGRWLDSGKPYLGICLGGQLLAHRLGATVAPHPDGWHEYGFAQLQPTEAGREVLPQPLHLYQAHYEGFALPDGAELLITGETYRHQAFRFGPVAYGFQFHPEVTPAMMLRWIDEDEAQTKQPGAHSRERQISDSKRFDAPMGAWLEGFLERWLNGA